VIGFWAGRGSSIGSGGQRENHSDAGVEEAIEIARDVGAPGLNIET